MSTRDELIRRQYEREVQEAPSFATRMRARGKLHAHGWGDDPWSEPVLTQELDRAAKQGVESALAEAGRALAANGQFDVLETWLGQLVPATREDGEAMAVLAGFVHLRRGEIAEAVAQLDRVPHAEAVALHGLALLQAGRTPEAASRLEILLAADALDEQGELPPTFLPEAMPVLALFLIACQTVAERALAQGEREVAKRHALAARDSLMRYREAPTTEGPSREEIAELVERVGS